MGQGPGSVWGRLADREQKCKLMTYHHAGRRKTPLRQKASVMGILTREIPQALKFFKIAIKHNETNEKNRVKDKLLKIPSVL